MSDDNEPAELEPQNVSMMFWMRGQAPTELMSFGGYGTTCSSYAYGFPGSNSGVQFSVLGSDSPIPRSSPQGQGVYDGQWHAIAGTFDGSVIRLYVDGLQVGDGSPMNAPIGYERLSQPRKLRIGGPNSLDGDCIIKPFRGDVDEARVYGRALNATEIAYLSAGFHRRPPTLPIPNGPKNTIKPTLSGQPQVGSTLTCAPGTWTGNPTSFEYLWERATRETRVEGDDSWIPINNAAGTTYTLTAFEDRQRIRCRAIATDANGLTGEALSLSKRVDTGPPVNTVPPQVTGTPIARQTLTCEPGTWERIEDSDEFRYQWLRDGNPIAGATAKTYFVQFGYDYGEYGLGATPLPDGDGGHELSCRVTASNDIGSTNAVSVPVGAVDGPPIRMSGGGISISEEANPLERTATCERGQWANDYLGRPGYEDEYLWFRGPSVETQEPIAGEVGRTFKITADVLGRYISCQVRPINIAGRTAAAVVPRIEGHLGASPAIFIPLPVPTKRALLETVNRDNPNDPINMTAIDLEYRNDVITYTQQLLEAQRQAERRSCERGQIEINRRLPEINDLLNLPPGQLEQLTTETPDKLRAERDNLIAAQIEAGSLPKAKARKGAVFTYKQRCQVLLYDFENTKAIPRGVEWNKRGSTCRIGDTCPDLGLALQPSMPTEAPALTAELTTRIENSTPLRLLWDIDGNGTTDISCPGSAPVLRSNLVRGYYDVNVVIVERSSETTGLFSGIRERVLFPNRNVTNPGELFKAGPKWCRTSMVPPPDPDVGPCTTEATVGTVRLQGNLCPINVRGIPSSQIDGLPPEIQEVIMKAAKAINVAEAARDLLLPGSTVGTRSLMAPVFRAATPAAISSAALNTAATIGSISQAKEYAVGAGSPLEQAVATEFNKGKQIVTDQAPRALDQIYSANAVGSNGVNGVGGLPGVMKVNGVAVNPASEGGNTIISPSDVSNGVKGFVPPAMRIYSKNAESAMGIVPMVPDPEPYAAELKETAKAEADRVLAEGINFTQEKFKPLIEKVNKTLGPFRLTGSDVKVTANDDGTATIHAVAELPFLSTEGFGQGEAQTRVPPPCPGGREPKQGEDCATEAKRSAIELDNQSKKKKPGVEVKLLGDLNGKLVLQGLTLNVPTAYLFGLRVRGLFLSYDNGELFAKGQLIFDAIGGDGIDIKGFRVDNEGTFKELNVSYLAGAGKGIPVFPGVFITKIGGGFKAPMPLELNGDAAISMLAPSAGGGCPTLGIDGGLNIHFAPRPMGMKVVGNVGVLCIPFRKMSFEAWESGVVKISDELDYNIPAIARLRTLVAGDMQTDPNKWQISARGSAEFPILPIPDVTLKAVLSNLGLAGCGSITIDLVVDEITIGAGVGVRFPGGGLPPSFDSLTRAFRAFIGCDLGAYTPLRALRVGPTAQTAQALQTFKLDGDGVSMSFEGAGEAPRVKLTSPSGKVYDYTTFDQAGYVDDSMGSYLPTEDRTVVIMPRPEKGMWQLETAPGMPEVARIQVASILPKPEVKAKVTGKGTTRTLIYDVKKIPGQSVAFAEGSLGGRRNIITVKDGGKGRVKYTVAESAGNARRIEAEVSQDGLPRQELVLARYSAPQPVAGRPRVRVRRLGTKAVVTWSKVPTVARYDVQVIRPDGARSLFTPAKRRVVIRGVGRREGLVARVTGITDGARPGRTGIGRLKPIKRKRG